MRYADWAFYGGTYGGQAVPEADFARVAERASRALDMLTLGRIDRTYARCRAVRMACCAVCDVLWEAQGDGGRVVRREKLDGYEVEYGAGDDDRLGRRIFTAARAYLWRTGLLSLYVRTVRMGPLGRCCGEDADGAGDDGDGAGVGDGAEAEGA